MTAEDLIVRLRIEEDNIAAKRRSKGNSTINEANIVEDGQNNSKKWKKVEHGSNQPKKNFKGKYFNCGKLDHKSMDCRVPKKGKKTDQANMIESNKECDDLCTMLSVSSLVGNLREWWMDSGATHHVCANKKLFSSFTLAQVEEIIYMANFTTTKVEGTGKLCLKMTSGKVLTLNNVLYVPELRRNLRSAFAHWKLQNVTCGRTSGAGPAQSQRRDVTVAEKLPSPSPVAAAAERANGDDHSQVKCSGVNLKDVSASVRGGEVEYRDDFVRANVTEDKLDDGTTYDKSKEASTNDDANQESAKAKGVTPNDDSKKESVCIIKKSI
ncbi:putative phosphoserine aminotransferase, chloroplastic-like [Capsicum annuum]|nr:putative phosphoserine aminotransferase, chloroplastic-like [Capsicum annuum]